MLRSSNPILAADDAFEQFHGGGAVARTDVATVTGVINRTAILTAICAVGGAVGYSIADAMPGVTWISAIAAFVIVLGVGFMIRGNPMMAGKVAWLYAVVEGVFLGALTRGLDTTLQAYLTRPDGTSPIGEMSLAVPAFVITMAVMLSVLGLYRAGIIRPTRRFKAVLGVAVGGIMIAYLISWPLAMFGMQIPYLSLGSAMQGGTPALIGLGISVVILIVAGLTLVMDFALVEELVESGAPRQMEWYAAFGLLVSLAWIYYEAVKLSFRLAMLFGSRE